MIRLLCGASLMALAVPASAADETNEEDAPGEIRTSREIVVQGDIGYRNRSDDAEPVLVYDEEYFQRFEPLTAGDAMKRVPSVTFLSDVIESDGARLRGLDPGYTQILINGEKVPGSNVDRSFFLDRIPAELVKQVEIVRSSSARRTGDAVAGTLNIVLRDAFTLDGGYFRAGGLGFDDGAIKPTAGFYYGGALGPGRVLFGLNVQGRYNPKQKSSLRYSDSPENNADFATQDFDNREDQSDVRDGFDYAANASWGIDSGTTKFELAGNFVHTNRTEDERSFEYNDPTAITGPVRRAVPGNLLTDNHNLAKIEQENWSVGSKLSHEWSLGETKLKAGYARFDDHRDEFENEVDFDRAAPRLTADLIFSDIVDEELSAEIEHAFPLGGETTFAIGGFYQDKDRDSDIRDNTATRNRRNLTAADRNGYDQFRDSPDAFVTTPGTITSAPGGLSTIGETRKDLFALIEGKSGGLSFEAGVRWENTDVSIDDLTVAAANQLTEVDYDALLPSASLKFDIGNGRITASAARTVRRPRFGYLSPVLLLAEYGDNDFRGNPLLAPEKAWGADLGYEHRLGRSGVIGVNLFYRKIENVVELTNTGVVGSEGAGTFVLQPQNTGDGEVRGIEFDLSADLGFIGLRDTGVFGNLSLIDSEIDDVFGTRRFNGQSKYVYNFGMIQNLRRMGAAFGATYRKQGPAFDRLIGEEITTTYGGDLEVFVEKRFGDSITLRAVGSNLLDGKKREAFNKFTTIADQIARDFDEYEQESERAGPVFQVIGRFAF
ncbi:TonB-dependent receptor plug domain-containing protein [Tsuneonella sp. HG094]